MHFIQQECYSITSRKSNKELLNLPVIFSFVLCFSSNGIPSTGKKTKGKQKIDIKVIENKDDKLITFSKRRTGIYKKLNQIATLCGTDFLFICFSPAGKPFSFGHPSIESVANRFLNNNIEPAPDNTESLVEAQRRERINRIIQNYNEAVNQLEAAKERAKALAQVKQAGGSEGNHWWIAPIDQLDPQELQQLESRHEEFLNQLYITRSKVIEAMTSSIPTPRDPPST
ncbi:agamous-like MADS-box protein AGL62 [Hibiscus syriacus]|uniref:agamous-like MADS-box protein AGL62 n=1 Tax=Hibiscus syriacus TaxID=106335 RepID=UPI001923D2C7|nr:agamous-like MADS-box protein AGL62 [Hibiscus syriacus]